jgi:MYXO-CTERM domain-containing protein
MDLGGVSSYGTFTITGSTLNWTAVPEPTSALAGLLLGAGLLRRRRQH